MWTNRYLGNIYSRTKGVHVELDTKYTEEANHLIKELMKGWVVKKVYGNKILLTPTMAR